MSWSVDLVTDLPESQNHFKQLLLCVDDFSNYTVTYPLRNASSTAIIEAIRYSIISPFGCPKYIRSDEQPGIYNSNEFYQFLQKNKIELTATAVASPFSNGRAETHIKIFKHSARKYFYQYKNISNWDENIYFITTALNQSVNTFNFSPEEIMFGYKIPRDNILLTITEVPENNETVINRIVEIAEKLRNQYELNKNAKERSNITYKNKSVSRTRFQKGDTVLHRQMQVSTGSSSKWKPLFTGPYIINDLGADERTAECQHAVTGKVIKAHYNNLVGYNYDPTRIRISSNGLDAGIKMGD